MIRTSQRAKPIRRLKKVLKEREKVKFFKFFKKFKCEIIYVKKFKRYYLNGGDWNSGPKQSRSMI